jgi:hypothetical protein
MNRIVVGSGILAVVVVATVALVIPILASTQTLPPSSSVLRAVETTYTAVGVAAAGSTGSVAWFIETNPNKERRPIACTVGSSGVECKRGEFP